MHLQHPPVPSLVDLLSTSDGAAAVRLSLLKGTAAPHVAEGRSLHWRFFLGLLEGAPETWRDQICQTRRSYASLRAQYLADRHHGDHVLDITLNNPLSQDESSPWHQFFLNNELKETIAQDVSRTYPDLELFRRVDVQQAMVHVLFCYAKAAPDISYRQGMHEVLAPVVYCLFQEYVNVDDRSALEQAELLYQLRDKQYLEHDAFALFSRIMETMKQWYVQNPLLRGSMASAEPIAAISRVQGAGVVSANGEATTETDENPSEVVRKLRQIQNRMLPEIDEALFSHLCALHIEPQLYGIRWIRLLFGREFAMPVLLTLWDALFADSGVALDLLEYVFLAMLSSIRDEVMTMDYVNCLKRLMHFPFVVNARALISSAIDIRNRLRGIPDEYAFRVCEQDFDTPIEAYAIPAQGRKQSLAAKVSNMVSGIRRGQQGKASMASVADAGDAVACRLAVIRSSLSECDGDLHEIALRLKHLAFDASTTANARDGLIRDLEEVRQKLSRIEQCTTAPL